MNSTIPIQSDNIPGFLSGDGEMCRLTREYNWSATSLGDPDQWPVSLRTLVTMMLTSRFPMLIFWGRDLITFYNDAFRPSLGDNGKHPSSLGQRGEESWAESWPTIGPMIYNIVAGGAAVWFEDQKLPIYREGRMDYAYWTYSFSPLTDDFNNVAGVLVTCAETTKAVEAMLRLEKSESRFQNLVRDATAGIVVIIGEQMKVEIVNDAYAALIDRRVDDLLGKNLFDVIPETRADFFPIIEGVRTGGQAVYLYDTPYFVWVNGQKKHGFLNLVYQPYKESDGIINGVMILCQDVTESVLAKKALEESEVRFRSLIEEAPVAATLFRGPDHVIEIANKLTLQYWGKGPEIVGKPIAEAAPELASQQMIELLDDFYLNGGSQEFVETPIVFNDNGMMRKGFYTHSLKALYNSAGVVDGILGIGVDVTEQVIARKTLEQSENRFRLLANEMPQFVWTGDPSGSLTYFNKAMYAYSGLSRAELKSDGWIQTVHPDDKEESLKRWHQAISAGTDFHMEHRFRRADGEYRWQLSRAVPQKDANGEIQQWIGTSTDIQDQKTIEESLENIVAQRTKELHDMNLQLLQSNEDLLQFAHVASHDLKEPVRKIKTFGNRLNQEFAGELSEKAKGYISKMESATNRMYSMIDGVLLYSTLSGIDQAAETIDLNEVLGSIEQDLELVIEQKKAIIRYASLPAIEGSSILIYQLFYNLINNSLKFSKAEERPVIQISSEMVREEPLYTKISVRDNGIGFEQKYAEKIFKTFSRLNSKDKYEGTGLGLSLGKKIVERHGGTITATGVEGEGAVFEIVLPLVQKGNR